MEEKKKNPLFKSQNEKAGSQTFQKYSYQYHWALYRVLEEHENMQEYAVFVELHEDVVISDSLNSESANFEFNQVKTNQEKFNTYQLVKKKKNGKCVLGKLISSGLEKPFSDQISNLNLVSLNDFKLELNEENVKLEKIRLEDLSVNQLGELESEIKKELDIDSLPVNIQFIVPSLSKNNFQNDVIAAIVRLINNLFPNSHHNALEIYRLLIDEIQRKGQVTYDFKKWDELLSKKALTSITVSKVINQFTSLKDEAKVSSEFIDICNELNLNSIEKRLLKRPFDRYRAQKNGNNSLAQLDLTRFFKKEIQDNIDSGVISISTLIGNILEVIPKKIKRQFHSDNEIRSAIICEFILLDNE